MSGVIFYVQYRLNVNHLTNSLTVSAAQLTNTLERSFEIAMLSRRLDEIQQMLEEIAREPQIERIFIVNKRGEIKVSSERPELGRVIQISERTCQVCHQRKPSEREQSIMIKSGTERFLRSVNPIIKGPPCEKCHLDQARVLGMLVTDISVAEIEALASYNLKISFIMLLLSVFLMAGAFGFGFKRIILDKLALLRKAAGEMERGDFSGRIVLPSKDELGQLAGSFNRMASNLRQSLERIEAARAYLEGLINSIDDGVAVIKRDRILVLANEAYLKMFDQGKQDRNRFLNAPIGDLNVFHGDWCRSDERKCNLCRVFETGQFSNRVVTYISKNGDEKVYESCVSVISRDENGVYEVVEDLRDISLRKKLEKQMVQREKLVSVGKLAAGVAHEINNPMASITTCAEGLISMVENLPIQSDHKSELYEYLGTIKSSAFRCKAITERLLNFSSAPAGGFELSDMNEIIRESVRLVEYDIFAKGVNVEMKLDPQLPKVRLSKISFPQVVVNLLLNSLYALQRNGTITLRTKVSDRQVCFEVEDNGSGISPENLSKVFNPFFTTKRGGEGSGLGLSICRTIVDSHRGEISIQSEVNGGTKVTVILPAEE
ncbi:MAG: PAS domain-containing sensor histidine kinase [Candidatus Binatia bacterium]